MRILYDFQAFNNQQYGGVSRFFCELLYYFHKTNLVDFEIGLASTKNIYFQKRSALLDHRVASVEKTMTDLTPIFKARHFMMWLNFISNMRILNRDKKITIDAIEKGKFDIFHPTYYDPYFLPYIHKKPFVLTVYDCLHERFPEFVVTGDKTAENKRLLISKARKIIAISQETKKDLMYFYNIADKKIEVVPLAPMLIPEENPPSQRMPSFQYLMYVGNRGGYKNFNTFIDKVTKVLKKKDLHIVCAGSDPFDPTEAGHFSRLGIGSRIHHVPIKNDQILCTLYKKAIAMVVPSITDGFSLPILEAFCNKCPVLANDSGINREIAGAAALYFHVDYSTSTCRAIESIFNSKTTRDTYIKYGEKRVRNFSLKKCAYKTYEVYKSI